MKRNLSKNAIYHRIFRLIFRDTLILAAFNEATCLISGFVIFSVIGFMAKTEGKKISEVADSGMITMKEREREREII